MARRAFIDTLKQMNINLILQNISQQAQLTAEEKEYFCSILKPRTYLKRQFILQQGDTCRYLNFVNKGCLRSYFVNDKGNDFNLQFAIEDWWITDYCSLYNGKPSLQNIEALENTEVLQIEKTQLDDLYLKIPKFEHFYRILLQKAFITHEKRILYFISRTAEERYLAFREYYGLFEQRIPQHHIASFIGVTPEFLSKIRNKIAKGY